MTTHTALSYAPDAALPDPDPFEPDDHWKSLLRERIQQGLANLVNEAKEAQLAELRRRVISPDERDKLEKDYLSKMDSIKQLGKDQFLHELQKERNQRRWSAGVAVDAESIQVLVKEQEQIYNSIKQKNQYNTVLSSSPISEHLSSKPPSPFPRPRTPESTHTRVPETNLSSPQRRQRRRDAEVSASADTQTPSNADKTPSRRGSERRTNGTTGEHTEDQPTSSRRANGQAKSAVHDTSWLTDLFEEPIDDRLPPRTKLSDKLQDRNWDSSLSRSSGSSVRSLSLSDRGHPPRSPTHPSDSRKVTEDPVSATAKAFPQQVHRRGSTASMRSTGSGASIRPMTETIPERIDDVEDDEWPEAHDGEQSRRMYEKRDKEKRPARRDSRAGHGDAPIRHDGPSSSMTMHNDVRERYYPEQQPPPQRQPMPASYNESRDQHFTAHRDHQSVYSRDPNRPPPSRPSYNSDDREYPLPPTTRPVPSRGSYNGEDPREQDFAARDLLASRPVTSRNGYSGDDREYPSPPPATVRSPGAPRPPYDESYSIPNGAYGPSPPPRMNGISKSGGAMNGSFMERDYVPPPPPPSHHSAPFGPYDDRQRWDTPRDAHWDEEREMREREAYMRDRERLEWEKRDREKREREQRDREREREREQERERDYDWDRSHPPYHPYIAQPPRTPSYPSPPPSASLSRHESLSYVSHTSNGLPVRTYSAPYRETNSVPPPPQDYDYSTGRADISRQASYSSRRESERRMETADPYAYVQYSRPSPSNDDAVQPLPAWRGWRTSPNDIVPPINGSSPASPYPRQQAPSTPAPPRPRGPAKPKRRIYRPKPPSPSEFSEGPYARTDTDSGSDDDEEEEEENEYDFEETDIFSSPPARVRDSSDDGDDPRRLLDESETSEGEMQRKAKARRHILQKQENELRRLSAQERRIEEETRRKEEEVRAKEAEVLRAKEAEIRRKEEEVKEKARLVQVQEEAARRDAEARARAEEVQRKAEEAQKKAEEVARKEEMARQLAEELKRKEAETMRVAEEARKIEEEAARKADEAKRKEAEAKKKEKEVSKREQDAKRRAADAKRLEEEAKRKEQELKKKEEAARKREEKLLQDAEKTKQMQEEAKKIAEQAKERQEKLFQLEEETRKREQEIRDREHALMLREFELKLREEEARRKEEDARREQLEKETEATRKELEEQLRKVEEAKQQDEARKRAHAQRLEDARKRREAAKQDEARKRDEEQRAQAEREEQERANLRKQRENVDIPQVFPSQDVDPRVQEEEKQREAIRLVREKRERELEEARNAEAARRLQDEDFVGDLDEDLLNDPKILEEQAFIWRQFQYQQQADKIQRSRQEQRSRQDSPGEPPLMFAPSSSPGKPSSIPRSSQSSQTSPQSAGPSSAGTPSWSSTPSAWTSYPKPAPSTSTSTQSSSPSWTPNGTHTPKPPTTGTQGSARPGAFNSTNFASSSSSFPGPTFDNPSLEDWQRRQNDFINDQQERFRREQEKIAAEVEMRSAGKVTREDMVKVFERHERLYSQLSEKASLTWTDFPWPMAKMPNTPDDISLPLITAYLQSPSWPDKEKLTTTKDRIKYHMKQWHPDRFDTKLLPKVTDSEKEKVRLGAGNVARYLSDLLQKENANSSNSFSI